MQPKLRGMVNKEKRRGALEFQFNDFFSLWKQYDSCSINVRMGEHTTSQRAELDPRVLEKSLNLEAQKYL